MVLCAPRKRRHHPAIDKAAPLFSEAMHAGDYEKAAKIALWAVLKVDGVDGIMSAMRAAISFLERKKLRKGLE